MQPSGSGSGGMINGLCYQTGNRDFYWLCWKCVYYSKYCIYKTTKYRYFSHCLYTSAVHLLSLAVGSKQMSVWTNVQSVYTSYGGFLTYHISTHGWLRPMHFSFKRRWTSMSCDVPVMSDKTMEGKKIKKNKRIRKKRDVSLWGVNKDVISSPGTARMSGRATSPLGTSTVWQQLFKMAIIRRTRDR